MDVAALLLWIVTATGGLVMAGIWVARRGPQQYRAGVSRLAPGRLAAHFVLAALGLLLWVVHVAADNDGPGWVALAVLPIVATLGLLMLLTWLGGRGAAPAAEEPAERAFPVAVVVAHGAFAVLTTVAVLVALVA